MYAVIFKATIKSLDEEYLNTAKRLRDKAMSYAGCMEFTSLTEGQQEIAISYWQSEQQIKDWKQDAEHLLAQKKGRNDWYSDYQVQVVKILRQYSHSDGDGT